MSDEGAADAVLGRLGELSADLRAGAVFDPDGSLIAAIGPRDISGDAWEDAARGLWEAAAHAAAGGEASTVHVGTEEGEVLAIRAEHASIVVAADRFALASLMFCDLRAALRDLVPPQGKAA